MTFIALSGLWANTFINSSAQLQSLGGNRGGISAAVQKNSLFILMCKYHHYCGRNEGGQPVPQPSALHTVSQSSPSMHQVHQPHVPQAEICKGFPGMHGALTVAKCQMYYSKEIFVLETCFSATACFLFNNFKAKKFSLVVAFVFIFYCLLSWGR